MYDKLSITFATLAGICFVSGLVLLSHPDGEILNVVK